MRGVRFVIVALVIAGLIRFVPFLEPVRAAAVGAIGAAAGAVYRTVGSLHAIPRSLVDATALRDENARLASRVEELTVELNELEGARSENAELRALFELERRSDLSYTPANVIGADPDASVDAVVIDRGSESGVNRGDAVVVGGAESGILVGKAESVTTGRTTVRLLTDRQSAVASMVQGRPEANGVARGERGLVLRLTLVPQNAAIEAGDRIVTTGLEPSLPRGLLVGSIDSVSKVPSEPFASATVIPSFDRFRLQAVIVIHMR